MVSAGLIFLTGTFAYGQTETAEKHKGEESETKRFGAHMAVMEFNAEEGFKLSEKGIKSLGVTFVALSKDAPWRVPRGALVNIKHSTAVYRRFDGWISLVLVKLVSGDKDTVAISSEDLQTGDEVAISGTQFLRMTESDLNSDTVDTCSH
ncbi:MAG TPA: hypothetical protein DCS07_09905 [Bdellovibrionales bacterium]|nr:hypothetical protein [Bdellovibrionales bacterium]